VKYELQPVNFSIRLTGCHQVVALLEEASNGGDGMGITLQSLFTDLLATQTGKVSGDGCSN